MTPALLIACLPFVCGAVSIAVAIIFPMSQEEMARCWAS